MKPALPPSMVAVSVCSIAWAATGPFDGNGHRLPVPERQGRALDRDERRTDPYLPPPRGGQPEGPPPVVRLGPFVSVQVNANTTGDAANEPSMAIDPNDPNRIAIGWRQFDNINSSFRQAGIAHSLDGGKTWPEPTVLDPGVFRTDPVLDSDPEGRFFYYSLFGFDLLNCDMFRSLDQGVTWESPVPAGGGDKNWMAVDHTQGLGSGHIYCTWRLPFSCCGPNTFTRSTDHGQSFEAPVPVPQSPALGTISVGPEGHVYISGVLESNHAAFRVAKSTNAQDPAASPSFDFVASLTLGGPVGFFSGGPNPAGLLGQVWVATDHSGGPTEGNVYVLCSVDPSGIDPLDVRFTRSIDGGLTWSPSIRVNKSPLAANSFQWFGTMSVAPNGRIDAFWNDTSETGAVNLSELRYAYSFNAGDIWSRSIPVSPVFDSFVGWPNQNKIGDYYHSISDAAGANIAWSATFAGEQDIYFLRVGDCNENGVHDALDIASGNSLDCNDNLIADECEFDPDDGCPGDILLADMNCDGTTNGLDVSPFVEYLLDVRYTCQADINQDGMVDLLDLPAFVDQLL